jgi:hypothetical protein
MNVPVYWKSKAQRGVTLSSSEVEYVAISEAVKEIKFMDFLHGYIEIDVELPMLVKTDNFGVLFMAQQHQQAYTHVTLILGTTSKDKALERSKSKFNLLDHVTMNPIV